MSNEYDLDDGYVGDVRMAHGQISVYECPTCTAFVHDLTVHNSALHQPTSPASEG